MRIKLPKALNPAYTMNVIQRQMLQSYDFMPTLIIHVRDALVGLFY